MHTLRGQLVALVSAALLALCLLAGVAKLGHDLNARTVERGMVAKDVVADILPPPMYLIELRLLLGMAVAGELSRAEAQKEIARVSEAYAERVAHWTRHPPHGLETQLLGEQHAHARQLILAAEAVLQALSDDDPARAAAALAVAHTHYTRHRTAVDATVKVANAFAEATQADLAASARQVQWFLAGALLVAAGLLGATGLWTLRSVLRSTGGEPAEVARIAQAVSMGDLTVRVAVRPGDDRSVMAAMARMCERLHTIAARVNDSSGQIAAGTAQIAGGNMDLSVRTEQQAASLQETAAAMDQFTGTVTASAHTAGQAAELSGDASASARQGAEVMRQVVATMDGIALGARRIGEITTLIDGLAFQTNILALNAAVEAARAGAQGRGFAVVAGEVRSLAQRSATAAREIRGLIGQSVDQVEAGTALVADAGKTMQDIVARTEQVATLISEISRAASEQTQGIGLVSRAVSELDSATQQNAALVEQSASAAQSVRDQADALLQLVRFFRTQGAEAPVAEAAA